MAYYLHKLYIFNWLCLCCPLCSMAWQLKNGVRKRKEILENLNHFNSVAQANVNQICLIGTIVISICRFC